MMLTILASISYHDLVGEWRDFSFAESLSSVPLPFCEAYLVGFGWFWLAVIGFALVGYWSVLVRWVSVGDSGIREIQKA